MDPVLAPTLASPQSWNLSTRPSDRRHTTALSSPQTPNALPSFHANKLNQPYTFQFYLTTKSPHWTSATPRPHHLHTHTKSSTSALDQSSSTQLHLRQSNPLILISKTHDPSMRLRVLKSNVYPSTMSLVHYGNGVNRKHLHQCNGT